MLGVQGTILPGVTRRSIIELARSRGYSVEEGDVDITDALQVRHQDPAALSPCQCRNCSRQRLWRQQLCHDRKPQALFPSGGFASRTWKDDTRTLRSECKRHC